MALHIKEFAGIAGGIQIAMQPDIAGTTDALVAEDTYEIDGGGASLVIVEMYAAGAAHTYTVTGGAGTVQHIASGERVTHGYTAGLVITVES